MSRDLSIFYLANRAVVEDLIRLGPDTLTDYLTVSDAVDLAGHLYNIGSLTEPASVVVEFDGMSLRRYAGEGEPPLGTFKLIQGAGPGGADQVQVAEQPTASLVISYSTIDEYKYERFELRGRNFTYVTRVAVGEVNAPYVKVLTDKVMQFKVLSSLTAAVVLANVRALVEMDESPAPTDMIFDISTRANVASGPKVLQQRFLTLLLSPSGADLMALIPKSADMTPQLRSVIMNRVTLAVNITRSRIQRSTPANASPDEVLAGASVESVSMDDATGTVSASVRLRTLSGRSVSLPLAV